MKLETTKILFGALTLRRFSAKEIERLVGANANTVSSTLNRYRRFFVRQDTLRRAGLVGKPPKNYVLTEEGAASLTQVLASLPRPATTDGARQEQWIAAVQQDIAAARRYHELYDTARSTDDRARAWSWFADAMMVLDRQLVGFLADGTEMPPALGAEIRKLRESLSEGMTERIEPVAEQVGFGEAVITIARQCIDELWGSRTVGDGARLSDLVDVAAIGTAASSMGVIAALGLSNCLIDSRGVRSDLKRIIDRLSEKDVAEGLERLLGGDQTREVRIGAIPAVSAGLRACREVLRQPMPKEVLLGMEPDRSWSPVVRGSYFMAIQDLPIRDFGRRVEAIALTEDDVTLDPVAAWQEEIIEIDPVADAIVNLTLRAVEYDERLRHGLSNGRIWPVEKSQFDLELLSAEG